MKDTLAAALALALPVSLLTNDAFVPFADRLQLSGREGRHAFTLSAPEPLFLEMELRLQAQEDERAGVVLSANGTEVAVARPDRFFVTHRAKPLIPAAALRAGRNELAVSIVESASATFDLTARLNNYYGLNPRFPRAFVVADAAVVHAAGEMPAWTRALRVAACFVLSLLLLWPLARLTRHRSRAARLVLLGSPSLVLWAALAFSLATPLHIWLPIGSVLALALVPCLLAAAAIWSAAHRTQVAQAAGVAAVTLLLLEIGLRLFNSVSPTFIFYADPLTRYRGEPGAPIFDSVLNSRGFHDAEHQPARPAHVRLRIAAVGDSVAFGVVPYRANYLTLLERELSEEGAVEVLNLGVAGTGPRDYLSILVREGLPFEPDVVMAGFFIGNDFEADGKKPYEHSYAATLMRFLWEVSRGGAPAAARADPRAERYDDEEPSLPRDRFLEIAVDRARIFERNAAGLAAAADRAAGYLREMRDLSTRAGSHFLVVIIPDEMQIDPALQAEVARASRLARDDYDFRQPNRVLADTLKSAGITFLDLLPVFETEGERTRLYKPRDTHWNLAGNRLAAARIAAFLRERGLAELDRGRGGHNAEAP